MLLNLPLLYHSKQVHVITKILRWYRMYIVFYVVFNYFTEKICSRHFRSWAGLCAHTRIKKLFQLSTFSKNVPSLDSCLLSENAPVSLLGAGQTLCQKVAVWRFSAPYFPAFRLNRENYWLNLHIQSKYGKIQTRKTTNMEKDS